jgi:serine/threonine protein phosphatase PrpC
MVNRATRLQAAGETHRGNVRSANEDTLIVEPALGLFAVLDGMGGHKGGGVASRLAGDAILEFVRQNTGRRDCPPTLLLQSAIRAASEAILCAREHDEFPNMGTTVVACLVEPRAGKPARALVSHAGDSRAYRLHHGALKQLTIDHTMVQELIDSGRFMTQEEIDCYAFRHVLTRSLGRSDDAPLDVLEMELAPGDRLLLCSDGLHTSAPADAIRRVLASKNSPEDVARQLVALALSGKGDDNISAVVIAVPG